MPARIANVEKTYIADSANSLSFIILQTWKAKLENVEKAPQNPAARSADNSEFKLAFAIKTASNEEDKMFESRVPHGNFLSSLAERAYLSALPTAPPIAHIKVKTAVCISRLSFLREIPRRKPQ